MSLSAIQLLHDEEEHNYQSLPRYSEQEKTLSFGPHDDHAQYSHSQPAYEEDVAPRYTYKRNIPPAGRKLKGSTRSAPIKHGKVANIPPLFYSDDDNDYKRSRRAHSEVEHCTNLNRENQYEYAHTGRASGMPTVRSTIPSLSQHVLPAGGRLLLPPHMRGPPTPGPPPPPLPILEKTYTAPNKDNDDDTKKKKKKKKKKKAKPEKKATQPCKKCPCLIVSMVLLAILMAGGIIAVVVLLKYQ